MEPFRKTTLAVVDPKEGMLYSWRVTATDDEIDVQEGMQITYSGQAVEVVFERAPKYTIVLEERSGEGAGEEEGGADGGATDEGAGVVRSMNVEVFCKYVRREIRSLFDDERDQMFDAMKVCRGKGREGKGEGRVFIFLRGRGVFFFFRVGFRWPLEFRLLSLSCVVDGLTL